MVFSREEAGVGGGGEEVYGGGGSLGDGFESRAGRGWLRGIMELGSWSLAGSVIVQWRWGRSWERAVSVGGYLLVEE